VRQQRQNVSPRCRRRRLPHRPQHQHRRRLHVLARTRRSSWAPTRSSSWLTSWSVPPQA